MTLVMRRPAFQISLMHLMQSVSSPKSTEGVSIVITDVAFLPQRQWNEVRYCSQDKKAEAVLALTDPWVHVQGWMVWC